MSSAIPRFSVPSFRSLRTKNAEELRVICRTQYVNGKIKKRVKMIIELSGNRTEISRDLHSLWVEQSIVDAICFLMALFWSQVAAVRTVVAVTGPIILEAFVAVIAELFVWLGLPALTVGRTFLSGRIKIMYSCTYKWYALCDKLNLNYLKISSAIFHSFNIPRLWFNITCGILIPL